MKTFPSTCVFLLIVIVMVQSAPSPPTPPPPPAIPHSKLAFQWPVTLCTRKRCKELKQKAQPPEAFKLHGLWPTNNNWTSSLKNCSGVNFTANPLENIRPTLQLYWPSYLKPENEFWKHEWDEHGKCSNLPLRQFFEQGLKLAKLHGNTLLPALQDSKISPGYIASTPAGIRNAIEKKLKVKCQLKCLHIAGNSYWLQEIKLCLDQHFNLQNCPEKWWLTECGNENDKATKVRIPINE